MRTPLALALRLLCAAAFAQAPDNAKIAGLLQRLSKEESPAARVEILQSLANPQLHSAAAFKALSRAALSDLSLQARRAAAVSALSYEGPEPLALAENILKNEQGEDVRLGLCLELSSGSVHQADPQVTDLLARMLSEDPSPAVRLAAVDGLARRADKRALPDLKRAADGDDDPAVRQRAKKTFALLMAPPKTQRSAKKEPAADYKAVKGKDRCPNPNGWCQCSNGALGPRPHCLPREDCAHDYETVYRHDGFVCTWDGQSLE